MTPPAGSIGSTQLATNLQTFTTDTFTGDGSDTTFTLSETPANANSIMVFVDGILQKVATNYALANNGSAVNSILIELDVANTGSSAVQVTVQIRDSSASASYHILKNAPVPAGGELKVVSGQKVVLNGDDHVRVYAIASTVNVVGSILDDVA